MQQLKGALLLTVTFIFFACGRLPIQSLELMDAISKEGERMHQLNLAFIENLFSEKKLGVDDFMSTSYTPELMAHVKKNIPSEVDMNKEWPALMQKLMPQIQKTRDSLVTALEFNREKILSRLNKDYDLYVQACNAQKELLSSVVKVDKSRQQAFNQFKTLSNNTVDLNKLEPFLDKILLAGGSVSQKILDLNDSVDNLLNNK